MNKLTNDLSRSPVSQSVNRGICVAHTPADLVQLCLADTAMVCWQRHMPQHALDWLERLDPVHLPRARTIVPVDAVQAAVVAALDEVDMPEGAGRTYLTDEVPTLASAFADLMKVPYLRLRLNAVDTNACRKFHVDAVSARLVCTYRGPGSQYGFSSNGADPDDIFEVSTGVAMLLRGLDWREKPASGLVHRSPSIEGTGVTRLVLVLDPIKNPANEH